MNTVTDNRYRLANKVVWRVGYGAMQLAGDGVFGPPRDRDEAVAVLRAAVDAGIDHIDTTQYYGPGVVNQLIRKTLFPYPADLALVSKVAARRDNSGAVLSYDDPDQLRAGIEENLATLGVEQLTAVNLRVMDNAVPDDRFVEQIEALVAAADPGDQHSRPPHGTPWHGLIVVAERRNLQSQLGIRRAMTLFECVWRTPS